MGYACFGVGASPLPEFQKQGIGAALVQAAERIEPGNLFWEKQDFSNRTDILYRNKALTEMKRFDM